MSSYRFNTKKVCCKQVRFQVEDGQLHNIQFLGGGCEGNLKALSALLEGSDATQAANMLRGTMCGKRGTSCGDQLALAIETAMESEAASQSKAS